MPDECKYLENKTIKEISMEQKIENEKYALVKLDFSWMPNPNAFTCGNCGEIVLYREERCEKCHYKLKW